jgi:hypothetical protein
LGQQALVTEGMHIMLQTVKLQLCLDTRPMALVKTSLVELVMETDHMLIQRSSPGIQ